MKNLNPQVWMYNLLVALEAVRSNKVRSTLTALGIIFGVAAVISMLAVGNGAEKEVMDMMKLVGSNNIVIQPFVGQEEEADNGSKQKQKYSPGLSLYDVENIAQTIPNIEHICPEIKYDLAVVANAKRIKTSIIGVNKEFFDVFNLEFVEGSVFSKEQVYNKKAVCVIGNSLRLRLFHGIDPINKQIKCGGVWYTVIGVLSGKSVAGKELEALGVSRYATEVLVPIKTLLLRYKNKHLVTEQMINASHNDDDEDNQSTERPQKEDHHQLSKITIQVADAEKIAPTVQWLERKLLLAHNNRKDFEIKVPELLLKQQQDTKKIFNLVLGAIAGISLLIGGIGIMNIMLASVMERIREIGVRMAIGAKKSDIRMQFMFEAVIISIGGGLIGVGLGFLIAYLIQTVFDIQTIISSSSVIFSFSVSAIVGIAFGYFPAKNASDRDPVQSLRYE
ncbi:ABC transporter permease [Salibacteraceae bacterium]|nr:ABC transporter permease [Salibacteraceae bacterium]